LGEVENRSASGLSDEAIECLRSCTTTGRLLGEASFVDLLEKFLDRILRLGKHGSEPEKGEEIS